HCRCVGGLVLPATLENAAEILAARHAVPARSYTPTIFDPSFLNASRTRPAPTWQIASGSNLLVHRDVARSLGGWNVDLGLGEHSVGRAGADADLFYRLLRAGYNVHATPRAVVRHEQPRSPRDLR